MTHTFTRTFPRTFIAALAASAALVAPPAQAKDDDVELVTCSESLGTIAVVDGDTQGWSEFGLGSPRALVNALASESGCFTPHSAAGGEPADFLMNIVAGTSEEVDQSIELAKSAAMEGLVRSGAASSVLSSVPGAGAVLGMFGGFGGKKKRYAAGIKLLSPANGLTIVTGSGEVRKSTIDFGGGAAWDAGADAAGYARDKKGRMLVEAFVIAFNNVVAQRDTIASVPRMAAASAEPEYATVRVATSLFEMPSAEAKALRSLGVGTTLTPTGRREGLFIEAEDNFGTKGWVSIESLD
ncbi:SH3 domain-containing protein [Erythrobacter sp.]|uniref:SH3 domain-containing protein n=1 Tax=Erythrobacter sp. TaxID=1042 RepID=UPI001425FBC0|nr:SH3 domain-containing protein [Erythrobacter sp.]QIQ87027.1 MAG: SH3 domain-containing protein [Erythrobacter sp.]